MKQMPASSMQRRPAVGVALVRPLFLASTGAATVSPARQMWNASLLPATMVCVHLINVLRQLSLIIDVTVRGVQKMKNVIRGSAFKESVQASRAASLSEHQTTNVKAHIAAMIMNAALASARGGPAVRVRNARQMNQRFLTNAPAFNAHRQANA